ncbi:MAG: hypothetical protein LBN23_07050 [Paludibacter sp.]|jgi:uncharacterized protein YabN with tetrapyrrole methylase and pyrophosphatase domain|nr:hypothetical protein [Paludibacter sp.]
MTTKYFNKINSNKNIIENAQNTISYIKDMTNFGYDTADEILNDLYDEISELKIEIEQNNIEKIESEIGDVAFVLCSLANKYKINLDAALKHSITEYQDRIKYIEDKTSAENLNAESIKCLWYEAKHRNK